MASTGKIIEMSETPNLLAELLPSWKLALQAEAKSPATVDNYTTSVRVFLRWCANTNTPAELDRRTVQAFLASLLAADQAASSVYVRQVGLKRFSKWLAAEQEIGEDRLTGLTLPKIDVKAVNPLTVDELVALFKACHGTGFRDRRDEAMARLLAESGLRAGELIALHVSDVDLPHGLAHIQRGKGGRGRPVPFGPSTAAAIDRYVRVRRSHKLAATDTLWLGEHGKPLKYAGLNRALGKRASDAGIARFHLHLLRHTAATRWLRAEGSEGGAMAVMGWRRREMLDRYVSFTASDRAIEESRRLGLGEL
jgi:site-specific recombinase XerD